MERKPAVGVSPVPTGFKTQSSLNIVFSYFGIQALESPLTDARWLAQQSAWRAIRCQQQQSLGGSMAIDLPQYPDPHRIDLGFGNRDGFPGGALSFPYVEDLSNQ